MRSARLSGQPGGPDKPYETGTVSISRNSTVLRGKNTGWHVLVRGGLPASPRNGKIIIDGGDEEYDVQLVNSDGVITLKRPFGRDDVQDVAYRFYEAAPVAAQKPDADRPPLYQTVGLPPGASPTMVAASSPQAPGTSSTPVAKSAAAEQPVWDAVKTIAYALAIALVIRAVFVQPFNIPSESMVPTLLKGDYLFVAKYPYGFSRHSLPFSPPFFTGRIFGHVPTRGDVVVFKLPSDGKTDYIKRLIGLPGDHIQVIDGVLQINGQPVTRERVDDLVETDDYGGVHRIARYRETLPDNVSFITLDSDPNGTYDNTEEFIVPPGHFFMMGDNRDNSMDSRAQPNYQYPRSGGVGFVPFENLVGRAEFIFFSTDGSARFWEIWKWPGAVRYGRLFEGVR
jgi:signal peptidase I